MIPLFIRLVLRCFAVILLTGCVGNASFEDIEEPVELVTYTNQPDLHLLDDAPVDNQKRGERVLAYFALSGCPQLVQQVVSASLNVICRVPGVMAETIVIGAHHDKTGSGRGVADNWTGIVTITALVEYFVQHPPQHTLEFVGFAEEETGMKGARHYLNERSQSHEPAPVTHMVNLDTLALGDLHIDPRSSKPLKRLALTIAGAIPATIQVVDIRETTGDWAPFKRRGIPILNLHSLNSKTLQYLHTYKDRRSLVDDQELLKTYQLVLNIVVALDRQPGRTIVQ